MGLGSYWPFWAPGFNVRNFWVCECERMLDSVYAAEHVEQLAPGGKEGISQSTLEIDICHWCLLGAASICETEPIQFRTSG